MDSIKNSPHELIRLAPTATKVPADGAGRVIVCGSHGGAYAGYLVAKTNAKAVILNDAGVGLDGAGIGALDLCEGIGLAAAMVAHDSARIGDAEDMWSRGTVSYANACAARAGCVAGQTCKEAALALTSAEPPIGVLAPYAEARFDAGSTRSGLRITCVDSISLVNDSDVGQIVISGSHGGLVAGQHGLAIRVQAAFALYHDAGVGIDDAGLSRLPVLNGMGVAAATVAASTARIGDARSLFATGIVNHVNALAGALGVAPGMTVAQACELIHS
jgi:hypothetical protein